MIGVIAAVLLSWWWKVEDARSPDQLPRLALDQPVDLGRSLAIPQSLEWRHADGLPDRLVLVMAMENITGETQYDFFGPASALPQLWIDGERQQPPGLALLRDGEELRQLQPRLPEQMELIWTQPDTPKTPEVEIRFFKEIFKLRDNLYGQSGWVGSEPAARLIAVPMGAS